MPLLWLIHTVKSKYMKQYFILVLMLQDVLFYIWRLIVGYNDNKTYCDWINDMLTINVIHKNIAEGISDLNSKVILEK